ncbi:sulfurtransferase complex subunit TusC [Arenicella sp. 4NH20-0111]|uniref:sulfurtransferase complex subunit TusC n=1 Tax=Arenicella sp. 4NH20-0111 TaxID=3127648 RepID=UPI003108BA0E
MNAPAKLLYVFERGPYSSLAGLEALDAAFIGASFEQCVSVLFMADGVFQLKSGQSVGGTSLKQHSKMFKALADFDVENVYVHDLSMVARGLTPSSLMIEAQELDSPAIASLINQQDKVFTF